MSGRLEQRQALTGLPGARPTIFPLKLLDETKNRNSQFLGRDDEVAGFSEFLAILAILDPVRSCPLHNRPPIVN